MGSEGFAENLQEESKKALQSETWQKVRDGIKEKKMVKHFTAENTAEDTYGSIWDQVVKEYLRSGYKAADSKFDIVVMGETYKVLKRPEVTAFYDAAGDTLFDVANERLEKEYECLINSGAMDTAEKIGVKEESDADGKGDPAVEQADEDTKSCEVPSAKQRAEEKLKKEMMAAKDKSFAEPIINYLMERCREDEGLAQDVVQGHKSWQKCFDYIYSQARKQANGNHAAVRDEVVYEWAEDYYHKDDKAEEEKKAKKDVEDKAKRAKSKAEKKTSRTKDTNKAEKVSASPKDGIPKEPPKHKRNGKEMEGQMDMFSMMGM
ncbi:MAG: hypothetical protein HFI97_01590 [Lachnospiraceae bacterium]|jgi:hypothetical protein|nr:hypothetical protein [Lachnospiraceae bacterium]MCI9202386.1 hypothetical protein [Lachnospiraceae bacterium]